MASELRKTGISVVGDVPWGTHFCYFYETKQDLLGILVPYFKAGLESKEFCLWIVSNSELITTEEAKEALAEAVSDLDRYLAEGGIEIVSHDEWFLRGGTFDFHKVAYGFKEKLDEALANGYAGLRINGSPAWIQTMDANVLREFESEADRFFANEHIIASCTYPVGESQADFLLDVARNHQFAIARRQGKWDVLETPQLKQAKQQIQKLNEELEKRVIERTKDLAAANEELRKEIAERKHAEALLHAREQEFRAIVENTPDQIARYDRSGRRTYVNPAFAKSSDLPAEELIGKSIFSTVRDAGLDVKEDELAQIRQRFEAVFDTGESCEFEVIVPLPTGRRYYSVRFFPELDLNGSVINVLGIARDTTERKVAEEELKKEKEVLEKIFDNIPVMIGFVGDDGDVKLVNPEWERTIGWTLKELQEQDVDIFAEAYPDQSYRQEVLDFVAASTGEWVDLKIKVRDGRVIDAACAVVHLSDKTKIAIAQDITERKLAEVALDERLRFETLVTELSAAFANLTTNEVDHEIDLWLQTLAEFLGVDRASFLQFGEDWTTLYRTHSYTVPGIQPLPPPPIGLKDQFPWITEQLRRGVTVKWSRIPDDMSEEAAKEKEYATKLGVKSGLNIPVVVGGSVICAIAFTSILTYRDWPDAMVARLRLVGEIFAAAVERKRAEGALRESEERFRQMAENIREVLWMCTGDLSKTLYISPAYEVVWGRTCESVYRDLRSVFAAIHPDDRTRAVTIIEAGREQGFEVKYRVVRPDGSIRWIWDRGFPIRDESGRSYRLAGIAEDITERKHAEEQLKATSEQLRALSARIHWAKEEEGTRIAREIHDELGGALTSLKWDLEGFHKAISESKDQSLLQALAARIETMLRLSETTISAVKRISSELRPSGLDDLGLAAAIEWQAQQFQARTGIICHCDCSLGNVDLNKEESTAIFRILQEALTNILRHAQATRVDIAIKEEASDVVLTVSDNGRGITEEEKSRLQSLGLLGMRERAHLIGGEIDIIGVEGQGTVVTVRVTL
jgi:PAS domain S-box-containing protein